MSKKFAFLFGFVAFIAAIGVLWQSLSPISTPLPSPTPVLTSLNEEFPVEQSIKYGDERPLELMSIQVQKGETALDVLSRSKQIVTKEYSFGKLVESIETVKNGTEDKYWMYYINNKEAKVGAGEYVLQPNDQVRWEFKKYEE